MSNGQNPDGPGNEVIIACTFTAAGQEVRILQDIPLADWALGDEFEAVAQVKIDAGASGLAGPYLYLQSNFSGGSKTAMDLYQRGEIGPQGGYTVDLLTDPLVIPSDLGAKSWLTQYVRIVSAGAGSATVRVRTVGCRKRLPIS